MIVDEPMGENGVRIFGFENLLEGFIVFVVHDGVAVGLICVCRASFQYVACLFCFCDASLGGDLLPCPIVQIEQHDFVQSRDRTAAAVLGSPG